MPMRPFCLPSCICVQVGVPAKSQSTEHDAVIAKVPQREQLKWPEAPKGYPPLPPSSCTPQKLRIRQEGGSCSETADDDSSSTTFSPTAPHTADSSPVLTSTVALLEQLANTPEVLQGRRKEARKDSIGKPPRPPPIEDTLQTSWTRREHPDRRWSGDTDETCRVDEPRTSLPPRGRSLMRSKSRDKNLRRQSSGSGSVSRRGQRIAPRSSEGESSPRSPSRLSLQRRRESSLGRAVSGRKSRTKRKVVVMEVDMPEEVQKKAIECARQAMDDFEVEKDVAGFIKKEFDRTMGPTWHCIVGQQFGSFVTYEKNCFIYFYSGQVAVMLFRSG